MKSLPLDIQLFLSRYDGEDEVHPDAKDNWEFYTNKQPCRPDNLFIEEIHQRWKGDYNELEHNHRFIQWLFPIREHGMNYLAQPLQLHEIELMTASEEVMSRLRTSYAIMLDFYGMELEDEETGLLCRSPSYRARYRHLCRSFHNYLRISRILKCLSELGLETLNVGFVLHVLSEQCEHGNLITTSLRNSMDQWWINCIRDEHDRGWIKESVNKVRKGELVFDRRLYELVMKERLSSGRLSLPSINCH